MPIYYVKPDRIEAVQYNHNISEICNLVRTCRTNVKASYVAVSHDLKVETDETVLVLHENDWLIKDSDGLLSVCPEKLFDSKYESE